MNDLFELWKSIQEFLPQAYFGYDMDNQVVIYTNYVLDDDGATIHPMEGA